VTISDNRKAFHDYFIEERYEAGLVLEGWEVKSIRAGLVHLKEAYVVVRNGALNVIGMHVTAQNSASTHVNPDPVRTRKLLLNKAEIDRLIGRVRERGYTLVPINLHFKGGRIKLEIALAKGKEKQDKRQAEKDREWKKEQSRLLKTRSKS
jgi:SsrA-binding protein